MCRPFDIEDCDSWIERNVIGNITKIDMKADRKNEINTSDMIQNFHFLYHHDCVLEM